MTIDNELGELLHDQGWAAVDDLMPAADLLNSVRHAHHRHRRYRIVGSSLTVLLVAAGVATGAVAIARNAGGAQSVVAPHHGPHGYRRYTNPRFGFSADIPASFVAKARPADGDGQAFRNPSDTADVTVYGENNGAGNSTLKERHAQVWGFRHQGDHVTLNYQNNDVIAVSGTTADGKVFYLREVVRSKAINGMTWTYPIADKPTYDPMVQHGALTFRPGPNRFS
jgi:hypothetical protein